MYKTDVFISAEEIKEIVGISKSKALTKRIKFLSSILLTILKRT